MKSWPLWKALAVFVPLSYAVALAMIVILNELLWPAPCKETTSIQGVQIASFPPWCFQYMNYQIIGTDLIVLAHAVFLFGLTMYFRRRGPRWLTLLAFALSILYFFLAGHSVYRFFYPDPSLVPLIDHF